jgi:chemotaxis signal transduction protein
MMETAQSDAAQAGWDAASQRPEQPLANKFLAIRIADQPCALRLAEVSGLVADKKIVRAPSREPALRGVAGFRGLLLPVYDLQALCGFRPLVTSRWIAIASATPIAFAFERFERLIGNEAENELRPLAAHEMGGGAQHVLRTPNFCGPVLDLQFFIEARARAIAAPKSGFST